MPIAIQNVGGVVPLRRSAVAQQTGDAYKTLVLEVIFNSLKSVSYFMFDKRGLAPDSGVSATDMLTDTAPSGASPLPN
jgi:hypothetical protein